MYEYDEGMMEKVRQLKAALKPGRRKDDIVRLTWSDITKTCQLPLGSNLTTFETILLHVPKLVTTPRRVFQSSLAPKDLSRIHPIRNLSTLLLYIHGSRFGHRLNRTSLAELKTFKKSLTLTVIKNQSISSHPRRRMPGGNRPECPFT